MVEGGILGHLQRLDFGFLNRASLYVPSKAHIGIEMGIFLSISYPPVP